MTAAWGFLILLLPVSLPFAYLDRAAAAAMLRRYRPCVAEGAIVSTVDIFRYVYARTHLERNHTAALIDPALNLYLIEVHADPAVIRLRNVVWTAEGDDPLRCFQDLRTWHDSNFFDSTLVGETIQDAADRHTWYAAQQDDL